MTNADRALLLAPGAGSGRDHPALVAVEEGLRPHGVRVERIDFPYRLAGRKAPDRMPVLTAAVAKGAASLAVDAGLGVERLILGGRSMGGRVCSLAVAGGLRALALVLVSYPLHPPGRPEKSRVDHLPHISVPCLFVSGTRDAFGTPAELEEAASTIPGPVTHVWIDGGDHGLKGHDRHVVGVITDWVLDLH